jgi:hypothetical protein
VSAPALRGEGEEPEEREADASESSGGGSGAGEETNGEDAKVWGMEREGTEAESGMATLSQGVIEV